jgi:integrase/recombinase XerC
MSYTDDFNNYLVHEKRFSSHTVLAYMNDLAQFYELLEIQDDNELVTINHRKMRSYLVALVDLDFENTSVNRKISSIKTFFRFLRQQGVLTVNPAIKIQSLKQKKVLPQFVPEKQLWDRSIFQDENDPYDSALCELILEVFYQTGIRQSELINLKISNINSQQIKVLGKRNKERIIPINKPLLKLIHEFEALKKNENFQSEWLFVLKNGKKLTPKFVYTKVNHYLGKATNLSKKSPHVLRHTFATHMLNNGASLEAIKKLLGHTDLSSTQIYTHNSFKQIKTIYEQSHPRGVER